MSRNSQSPNTQRAAEEKAEIKNQAILSKEAHDRFEAAREADPDWTAVITYRDDKTLKKKWMITDALNDSIL